MSDISQVESDSINPLKLRIAAMILSGVIGAFVSYWVTFGLHSILDLISIRFAHNPLSWIFSILVGIFAGLGSAYWMNLELARFIES